MRTHLFRAAALAAACALVSSAAAAQSKAAPKTAPSKAATSTSNDADQRELLSYTLTMDKVQKLAGAIHGLGALAQAHPELKSAASPDNDSLDAITKRLQQYPDAVAVLAKNGLSPREFAVGSLTLMQSAMAVGFKKSGVVKEYPAEMTKLVSPANLAFVEQHYDDITKAMPEMSAGK
jgi:hypothetical protein